MSLPRGRCTLDFTRENPDGASLEEIGEAFGGLTRERIRQIESAALAKISRMSPMRRQARQRAWQTEVIDVLEAERDAFGSPRRPPDRKPRRKYLPVLEAHRQYLASLDREEDGSQGGR